MKLLCRLYVLSGMVLAFGFLMGCSSEKGNIDQTQLPAHNKESEDKDLKNEIVYQKITASEAKEQMDHSNVIVVDVRTPEEFELDHIPNAVLIPLKTISNTMPNVLPDMEAEILVYCRSGARSKEAALILAQLGYSNVFDFGGIIDWPYETTSDINIK